MSQRDKQNDLRGEHICLKHSEKITHPEDTNKPVHWRSIMT